MKQTVDFLTKNKNVQWSEQIVLFVLWFLMVSFVVLMLLLLNKWEERCALKPLVFLKDAEISKCFPSAVSGACCWSALRNTRYCCRKNSMWLPCCRDNVTSLTKPSLTPPASLSSPPGSFLLSRAFVWISLVPPSPPLPPSHFLLLRPARPSSDKRREEKVCLFRSKLTGSISELFVPRVLQESVTQTIWCHVPRQRHMFQGSWREAQLHTHILNGQGPAGAWGGGHRDRTSKPISHIGFCGFVK